MNGTLVCIEIEMNWNDEAEDMENGDYREIVLEIMLLIICAIFSLSQ